MIRLSKETLEYKRSIFYKILTAYKQTQRGGLYYQLEENDCGWEYADRFAAHEKYLFEKYCADAKLDTNGNPLCS